NISNIQTILYCNLFLLRVHLVNGLKFKLNNELMVVVGDLRACIFPKMRVFFMPKKSNDSSDLKI
ncbi:hypothetical protein CTY70_15530, partial [Acinetobacter baumannii]|nr:hypothetical protein [Acinetobacter baumannii]